MPTSTPPPPRQTRLDPTRLDPTARAALALLDLPLAREIISDQSARTARRVAAEEAQYQIAQARQDIQHQLNGLTQRLDRILDLLDTLTGDRQESPIPDMLQRLDDLEARVEQLERGWSGYDQYQ